MLKLPVTQFLGIHLLRLNGRGHFADAIKKLSKKDKSSKYIGGLMQHKNKYILVCTVAKHRDTVEELADAVLSAD